MFEIYSIGDGAFLATVLNAVAMLSGSGNLQQLAGIGFLIGVILMMFQGLVRAQFPPLQNALIAWAIYMGMFGPTVTVTVEDLYTGAVRVVGNVPLGPAAIGSAMSQVGYGVTILFEQAFSTPAMTDYGFAAPLQLLQNVRKGTLSRAALGAANSPTPMADVERSWVNSITECTLYEVDIGKRPIEDVLSDPSWQTFATGLVTPTTELWLGANPVTKPCDEAWADLSAYTTSAFTPALRQSLAATLSLNVSDLDSAVQSALDAIAGAGVDAQNYLVMAAAVPFLEKAQAQVYKEIAHWEEASMVTQAVAQRNTQWAAEETLFARIVRPMMTFFEAFLFAVSPLMVFVIGLGPVGIAMVGKYLLFGLWIQLWQPILAIVNLYIIMAISGKMEALQAAGMGNLELPSVYAMWKLDFLLSDYLGVGGMLAASTPAISLMLIYGSAITATHLAGRLQGGDHINEKIASPDVMNPAPALTLSPIKTHTPTTGTTTPNANSVLWSADVGRSMQTSLRSSEQAMEQASQRFSASLAGTASATASRSGESFDARTMGWDYGATGSATDRTIMNEAQGLTQKYEQSGMSQQQMAAVISGTLSGRWDDSQIASRLQSQYGVDEKLSDSLAGDISKRIASDAGFEARLAESIKADTETGRRNVFAERLSSEERSSLQRDASDVLSTSRSLERDQSMARRYGAMGSFGAAEIGNAIARDPAMRERLYQEIDRRNLTGDHQQLASSWAYADNLSRDAAGAAAAVALLIGHADGETLKRFTPAEAQSAKEAGYDILADTFGTHGPSGIDPYQNTRVEGAAPSYGSARAGVEGTVVEDPRGQASGLRDEIRSHGQMVDSQYHPSAADRFHAANQGDVAARHQQAQERVWAEKRERIGAAIDQKAVLPRPAAHMVHNELGGVFVQLAESGALMRAGVAGVAEHAAASGTAFGSTLIRGAGLSDAVTAAKEAAGGEAGWSQARETLIDARMQQIAGYGLTAAQQTLFREATGSLLSSLPSDAQDAARQAVIDETGGARGQHIADLIERSAGSRDDSDLRLIGTYNSQGAPPEKKTEPVTRAGAGALPPGSGGGPGARVLDLVASAESNGNYNAWYRNADQSRVELSQMTVDQIRDLQRQLVHHNGGSAIGRYQIIDETLDSLKTRMGLTGGEYFTPAMQDRMGLLLAQDAGLESWLNDGMSHERFAYSLSQVWAGLPKDTSNESYYEGYAENRANVSYSSVMGTLQGIRGTLSSRWTGVGEIQ